MSFNTTKNTARVGILIPTYERLHFLEKSLISAINQTYRELEIIIVDNGKSDVARNLAASLNDPRVQYIRNKHNIYLTGSIRKGMLQFSSEVSWVTILPDDDLLERDFVKAMVDYVKCHPDITVVHSHRKLISATGEPTGETSLPPERETAVEYLINRSLFIRQTFLCGVFFCRSAYERIGGYPEFTTGMATDDALIFGLSLKYGLCFNNQAVALVRMYPEAESHSSLYVIGHIRAFEDFRNYILKISTAENSLSNSDLNIIHKSIDSYTRVSIGGLWLRRVHELLLGALPLSAQELSELYALVRGNNLLFPLRVRLDAFFARIFVWNLESSKWYRIFWDKLSSRQIQRSRRLWRRSFGDPSRIKKTSKG